MTAPSNETDEPAPFESEYDRKARELESVLRNMPIWKPAEGEAPPGIPYDFLIPGIVRLLILASLRGEHAKPKAKSAKNLASLIAGSVELLKDAGYVALLPQEIYLCLLRIARFDAPTVRNDARAGAPRKQRAARVAEVFGRHFFGLTAEHPSGFDDGLFQSYLAEIYKVLGIKAKAVSQAKQAAKLLKNFIPNPMEFISG